MLLGHDLQSLAPASLYLPGLHEVQYGLLSSYAFTALYSVASLAAGAACDIFARAPVLVAASALWSGAAALQGCASSYPQLLASRAVLGVSPSFPADED